MSTTKPGFLAATRASNQRTDMTAPQYDPIPSGKIENPKRYYSPSMRGFLTEEIHGSNVPADAIEISYEEWQSLLDAQTNGKQIVPGENGKPIAIDRMMTAAMRRLAIETQIDALRRAPDTLDLARAAALGTPGAKDQLQAVENQILALRATLPTQ